MSESIIIGINDLAVAIGVIIFGCGMVVTLWQAIKAIREMTKPAKDLMTRVDLMEDHLANDKKRLDDQEEAQKLLLRGMLVLVEHEAKTSSTGNQALEDLKGDISKYLINR